jgi:hypothetical protein
MIDVTTMPPKEAMKASRGQEHLQLCGATLTRNADSDTWVFQCGIGVHFGPLAYKVGHACTVHLGDVYAVSEVSAEDALWRVRTVIASAAGLLNSAMAAPGFRWSTHIEVVR